MADFSFPQTGDLPDFAHFATLRGTGRSAVINGLTFSVDFSVPEVTVGSGKALINRAQAQTTHPQISPAETVTDAAIVVEPDQKTVTLVGGQLNHIYLVANVNADDAPQIQANTAGNKPTVASLKIGEVDTASNISAAQFNKLEADGALSFPTAAAANDALSRLPDGVAVIDRGNDIRLVTDMNADSITATAEIVDPSGEVHTGELADAVDAVTDHANLVNVQTDQHHDKGATATEKRFIAHQIGDYY
jgi:hypothetical protein